MEFRILSEKEFRDFSSKHKYKSFFQTIETGLLREKSGFKKYFVGLVDNKKVIAATLLVSKRIFLNKNKFYAPRGYLIDFDNYELLKIFSDEVKKFVKTNNGLYIKIDPYVEYIEREINGDIVKGGYNNQSIINNLKKLGYRHYGFTLYQDKTEQVRWMFTLDLENKSEELILKEMKQSTRTRINKTLKYEYEVKELKKEDLKTFIDILEHTGNRKGFKSQNLKYFENLYDIYGKTNIVKFLSLKINLDNYKIILEKELKDENIKKENIEKKLEGNPESKNNKEALNIVLKEINDITSRIEERDILKEKYGNELTLSSAMFITYGDEIIYLSSGNYEEFMSLNGQYRLQWEMIKYGVKNNFKRYNFYGISGNFDTKDSQYGIYNFKRGFNGKVVELIGEFDLPTHPLYYLYNILKKLKHLLKK